MRQIHCLENYLIHILSMINLSCASASKANSQVSHGNGSIAEKLPPIRNSKRNRKSVRFNMDKNVTFNVQPAVYEWHDIQSENEEEGNTSRLSENVRNASDLDSTDDSDDEPVNAKHKSTAVVSDKGFIMKEIVDMEKQKSKLAQDLEELRHRHEREMKQLREEYRRRREDYYIELDSVQEEMERKRNEYNEKFMAENKDLVILAERKQNYAEEKREIEEKEEELQQKKENILEQEKELQEYESYLQRRHKSLNKKEEDLCLLQDELEELGDVLQEKEEKIKMKQERLVGISKVCYHNEDEIEKTRERLSNYIKIESETERRLQEMDEKIEADSKMIMQLEEDKRKMATKIKHLESHLFVGTALTQSSENYSNQKMITSSLPGVDLSSDSRTRSGYLGERTTFTRESSVVMSSRNLSSIYSPHKNETSNGSPTKSTLCVSNTVKNGNDVIVDKEIDSEKEIYKDSDDLYASDTTLLRRNSHSALSKMCYLI